MKNLYFFIAIAIFSILISCSSEPSKPARPLVMKEVDLSSKGLNILLAVPDTIVDSITVNKVADNSYEIRGGDENFGKVYDMSVWLVHESEQEAISEIERTKKYHQTNTSNKLKRYLIDEPKLIMWESQMDQPEFHFIAEIPSDSGYFYVMKDESLMHLYTENEIRTMLNSAKSIKVKK